MTEIIEKRPDDELEQDEDGEDPSWGSVVAMVCALPSGRLLRRAMRLSQGWLIQTVRLGLDLSPLENGEARATDSAFADTELLPIETDPADVADALAIEGGVWVMQSLFTLSLVIDGRVVSYEVTAAGASWLANASLMPHVAKQPATPGVKPAFDLSPEASEVRTFATLREAFELCESGWIPGVQ